MHDNRFGRAGFARDGGERGGAFEHAQFAEHARINRQVIVRKTDDLDAGLGGGGELARNRFGVLVRADDDGAREQIAASPREVHDAPNRKPRRADERNRNDPREHEPTARDAQVRFEKTEHDQHEDAGGARGDHFAVLLQAGQGVAAIIQAVERKDEQPHRHGDRDHDEVPLGDRREFLDQREPIEIVARIERDVERGDNRQRVAAEPQREQHEKFVTSHRRSRQFATRR